MPYVSPRAGPHSCCVWEPGRKSPTCSRASPPMHKQVPRPRQAPWKQLSFPRSQSPWSGLKRWFCLMLPAAARWSWCPAGHWRGCRGQCCPACVAAAWWSAVPCVPGAPAPPFLAVPPGWPLQQAPDWLWRRRNAPVSQPTGPPRGLFLPTRARSSGRWPPTTWSTLPPTGGTATTARCFPRCGCTADCSSHTSWNRCQSGPHSWCSPPAASARGGCARETRPLG